MPDTGTGWPATRKAIDTSIERARRELDLTVRGTLWDLGTIGHTRAERILAAVKDSLDDIDQTIPAEDDDGN